jgi:hypothetical protein
VCVRYSLGRRARPLASNVNGTFWVEARALAGEGYEKAGVVYSAISSAPEKSRPARKHVPSLPSPWPIYFLSLSLSLVVCGKTKGRPAAAAINYSDALRHLFGCCDGWILDSIKLNARVRHSSFCCCHWIFSSEKRGERRRRGESRCLLSSVIGGPSFLLCGGWAAGSRSTARLLCVCAQYRRQQQQQHPHKEQTDTMGLAK